MLVHTFHGHVLDGYFPAPVQRAFIEAERALARWTDVLIAVSEEVREDLLDLGIGEPEQWRVIRLGLDLDAHWSAGPGTGALRRRLRVPDHVPLLGVAGRLVAIKDLHTLFDAVARLPGVHLAVLGDGELRVPLQERASRSDLAGRVHFLGWWADMPSAMVDLDLAVLSSRNEGTPVALIEAAACGIPAVATAVGGVRTVVDDGVTGLLVPPQDPASLASAISSLLEDPAKRLEMARAARARSREFSSARLVEDIRALYASLLP